MKLGLLTAPFPRRSLRQVAEWASSEGFQMLEVACWPAAGGERRRYAGTSHIDVTKLDADAVLDMLQRFTEDLTQLQRAIRWGDGDKLFDHFTKTRAVRRSIIEQGQDDAAPDFGRHHE